MSEPSDKDLESRDLKQLFPIVYEELRRVAANRMRNEGPGQTLQPTGLVNEVYIRLAHDGGIRFQNRSHFFAIAGRVMRQVLVDRARSQLSKKRGGRPERIEPTGDLLITLPSDPASALAVDEALIRLEKLDARMAKIVELKFFAGLSDEEAAEVLDVSTRTVRRDWNFARAWLQKQLE